MKFKKILFCLGFSILIGCSNANLQYLPYILNDELSLSYQKLDSSLKHKRSKLRFSGDQEANDCNSYSDVVSKHSLDESIHNQLVKSEYLICDALKILSNSLISSSEKLKKSDFGIELLSKLDLRSFPSSLNMASSDESHTLKSIYPSEVSYSDNVAELQTEDWTFTMEVVALAKINDNSTPDWIVWITDESKSGNYRGYSTVILYDPEGQETYSATVFP